MVGLRSFLVTARNSFETDMGKRENCIIIDKVVENGFNLACGVQENLSKGFPCSELCTSRNDCSWYTCNRIVRDIFLRSLFAAGVFNAVMK